MIEYLKIPIDGQHGCVNLRVFPMSSKAQVVEENDLSFCNIDEIIKTNHHVLPPSHPSHHLSAAGGDRPRLRVDAHRVSAHALRLGARRHRRTDYPEQE